MSVALDDAARALLEATACLAKFADYRWLRGEYVLSVTDARISADQMEAITGARDAVSRALGIDPVSDALRRNGDG